MYMGPDAFVRNQKGVIWDLIVNCFIRPSLTIFRAAKTVAWYFTVAEFQNKKARSWISHDTRLCKSPLPNEAATCKSFIE